MRLPALCYILKASELGVVECPQVMYSFRFDFDSPAGGHNLSQWKRHSETGVVTVSKEISRRFGRNLRSLQLFPVAFLVESSVNMIKQTRNLFPVDCRQHCSPEVSFRESACPSGSSSCFTSAVQNLSTCAAWLSSDLVFLGQFCHCHRTGTGTGAHAHHCDTCVGFSYHQRLWTSIQ